MGEHDPEECWGEELCSREQCENCGEYDNYCRMHGGRDRAGVAEPLICSNCYNRAYERNRV